MRFRTFALALALVLPVSAAPQGAPKAANLEKFDVAGLPKTGTNDAERQILQLLRYHKKGDLKDAARIHMMLAEYYKERGEKARADDCKKMAGEAWDAAESGVRTSAGSPGSPPFDPAGAFTKAFGYTDDVGITHRWEFWDDGTFAHSVTDTKAADATPITELGWYSILDGQVRLWQQDPASDRTVPFSLQGKDGKDGAILDGSKMKPVK
jgi:hypothetical protein